jgi:hypothetical protein
MRRQARDGLPTYASLHGQASREEMKGGPLGPPFDPWGTPLGGRSPKFARTTLPAKKYDLGLQLRDAIRRAPHVRMVSRVS